MEILVRHPNPQYTTIQKIKTLDGTFWHPTQQGVKKRQKVQISSHLQFTIRYVICSAHSVEIAVMLLPNQLRNPVIFSGSDRGAFFKGGGFRSMGKKAGAPLAEAPPKADPRLL